MKTVWILLCVRERSAPLGHPHTSENQPTCRPPARPPSAGKGLYSVDIKRGFSLDLIVNLTHPGSGPAPGGTPDQRPPLDIEWNWNTRELYACGHGGVIRTYRQ